METLFDKMKIFDPSHQPVIRLIELEKWTHSIKAFLYEDGEDATKRPVTIRHSEFEKWLDDNGYFDINDQSNSSDPVTGEHVQTDYSQKIDYMMYLDMNLCPQDVYDFLVAMGRTHLKYVPE